MKKHTLFPLWALLILSCSQKTYENKTIIKGEVALKGITNIKFEINDNSITGKKKFYSAEIDSNSNFSIEIPINKIAKGIFVVGKNYYDICFIPGDKFTISINDGVINYLGKGSEKNNFLNQAEQKGLSQKAYKIISKERDKEPVDFLKSMATFKQDRIDLLESYKDSVNLSREFIDLYKIETQVFYEEAIQKYSMRYCRQKNIPYNSSELPKEFIKFNQFSNYIDDSKVISSTYITALLKQIQTKEKEILKKDPSINRSDAIDALLFDSLSGKTREYVLTKWIIKDLAFNYYDTARIERFNKIEKGKLAQNTYNLYLSKYNEKQMLIGQSLHKEFSNTLLRDTSGVQLTFEEMMEKYQGKVVYLDLWGLWCGPCRSAMPHARTLKKKLGNEAIEFVYIIVDGLTNNNWHEVFEASYTNKNHYVLENGFNSRLHKFMEIRWIPNYMIFDKEGNLIDFNADRPSKMVEQTATELEKTLKELAS